MKPQIALAQQLGRIRGFRTTIDKMDRLTIGGYDVMVLGARSNQGIAGAGTGSTVKGKVDGYGLIIQVAEEEFLLVAKAASLYFSKAGKIVEVDWAQEGQFEKGEWIAGRTLNGDERHALFSQDKLGIVRLRLTERRSN